MNVSIHYTIQYLIYFNGMFLIGVKKIVNTVGIIYNNTSCNNIWGEKILISRSWQNSLYTNIYIYKLLVITILTNMR